MQLGCVWNSPTPDFLYFLKHISLLVSIFVYASGHLPLLLFILSKKKKKHPFMQHVGQNSSNVMY